MTREEAIKRIQDHMRVHKIGEYPHIRLKESLDMAISALRAQQDLLDNPPLTLEELLEMEGEPVYLRHDDLGFLNGWKVIDCVGKIRIHFTDRCSVLTGDHGVCLRAYRRKPEEGET